MKRVLWVVSIFLLSVLAHAEEALPMERVNPNIPISRTEIIAAVEHRYEKSQILSMQSRPTNAAPDCHIVRVLKSDGEMIQLYVAC